MYEVKRSAESGRVIAFWGPIHRQGAISTTTALSATLLADRIKGDEKLLVMTNDISAGPTAGFYMTREEMPDGLIEVVDLADSDNLRDVEDIYNNTFSTYNNKIDILATNRNNVHLRDQLPRLVGKLFETARSGYKYVLVDTASGAFNESTLEVLRNCDMIVVCLPQDKHILDSWLRRSKSTYVRECDNKKTMIVVTQYWDYRHIDYDFLHKQLAQDIWLISLNDLVHEAVSSRDIVALVQDSAKSKNPDDVVIEVNELLDGIIEGLQQVLDKELVEEREREEEARRNTNEYIESLKAFDDAYEETPLDSVTAERLLNIDKMGTGKTGWDEVADEGKEIIEDGLDTGGIMEDGIVTDNDDTEYGLETEGLIEDGIFTDNEDIDYGFDTEGDIGNTGIGLGGDIEIIEEDSSGEKIDDWY